MRYFGLVLILISNTLWATEQISAKRQLNISWTSYKQNYHVTGSIQDEAIRWSETNKEQQLILLEQIPAWPNFEIIQNEFERIRDLAFIKDPISEEMQPIAWRYIDDYCFDRAAAATKLYNEYYLPKPAKIFVFGDLQFLSPYHINSNQLISYWFHVAPVIKDNQTQQVYILDPGLNWQGPLTLSEWLHLLTQASGTPELHVNVCNGFGSIPSQRCQFAQQRDEDSFANNAQFQIAIQNEMLQLKHLYDYSTQLSQYAYQIYGKFTLEGMYPEQPLFDAFQFEYKIDNEKDWHVLIDLAETVKKSSSVSFVFPNNTIYIGSGFAKTSRDNQCQCILESCYCNGNKNDNLMIRVLFNGQLVKQCKISLNQLTPSLNAINIAYKATIDNYSGKIDPASITGEISPCS